MSSKSINLLFLFGILLAFQILGCTLNNHLVIRENQEVNKGEFILPMREGNPPEVGQTTPQLQFTDKSPREIYDKMKNWMFSTFPGVREEPTRISVSTTIAMWLDEDMEVGNLDAFMPTKKSREFTHLHLDGSIHTVVAKEIENEIISKKWGVRHMYYDKGVKEILVYAPRNMEEIEILKLVIIRSYEYATGLAYKKEN